MKRIALAIAVLLAGIHAAIAIDPLPFKDRAEEVRFQNLARQLRCLVCQNQDLADSEADLAKDLRRQVFQMMQSGKSDDEIKQYLVSRYNIFVLYDPPLQAGTWLLWFGPFAMLGLGAFIVVRILRKRTRTANAQPESSEEDW
jgi:cytochrome c-type biogenesis protein CcmH